jgi:hypothetical protein
MKNFIKIIFTTYFFCFSFLIVAQEKIIISGNITSDTGIPVKKVKIFIENKKISTKSDKKGDYKFVLTKEPKKIKFKSSKYGIVTIDYKGINSIDVVFDTKKRADNNRYSKYLTIYEYLRDQPGIATSGSAIYIRGVSSINASTQPLFIVDGVYSNTLNSINMSIVKKVKILRTSDEVSIYGLRGGSGVIIINHFK